MANIGNIPVCAQSAQWRIEFIGSEFVSELTGSKQFYHRASRWVVALTYSGLDRAKASELEGFVSALHNKQNTFNLMNHARLSPLSGSASGSISGSGETPTFSGSGLSAGDFISSGGQLVQVASLSPFRVAPGLRNSGGAITSVNASGEFRLQEDGVISYTPGFTDVTLMCEEVML